MNKNVTRAFSLLSIGIACAALAAPDKRGCADHPLFPTRMPEYYIVDCQSKEFDAYDFFVAKGPKLRQEGKFTYIAYHVENRKNEPSGIAVVRNYENAITKIGGTIAASDPQRWVNGKVVIDGREVWAQAEKGNGAIWLRIIEKEGMKQHVVADAASFSNDLKASGHVAVYGIYFGDPALKLWVVGHTDSVGKVDDNMRLAQARAEAVASELVNAHGIAAARLKGYGVGPLSPVAGNGDEAGRAKNRRVELVKSP